MKEKLRPQPTFSHLLCFRYLLDLIKARPCSSVLGISTSVLLSHWHRHTILRFRCCAWPGAYQDTPIMHTLVCPSSASVSSSVFASVSSCVCVCLPAYVLSFLHGLHFLRWFRSIPEAIRWSISGRSWSFRSLVTLDSTPTQSTSSTSISSLRPTLSVRVNVCLCVCLNVIGHPDSNK